MKRLLLAALLSAGGQGAGAVESKLTILYTGDTHGVLGYPGFPGGLAARKRAIEDIRRENPRLLILDSGNALAPFYFSRLDRGQMAFSALADMGYHALNLGSHDFNYGQAWLRSLSERAPSVRLLSSNLLREGAPWVEESIVREIDGVRVAIIGLCDPGAESETIVGQLAGLSVASPEAVAKALVAKLRPQVDVLVLLSNIPAQRLLALVEATPGLDVVISRSAGGETEYSHYPTPRARDFRYFVDVSSTGPAEPRIRTVFAYASRFGFELGRIDVTLGAGPPAFRPAVVELPIGAPGDEALTAKVNGRVTSLEQEYGSVLLDRLGERLGRPWNLEDFLHLVLVPMKDAARSEIAVINDTAFFKLRFINDWISRSDRLAEMDLHHLFWTDNHLVRLALSGAQLKQLLRENRASPRLRFLGLTTTPEGGVLVNGRPAQDGELYSVATSNYLAGGAHAWPVLAQGTLVQERVRGGKVVLRDLLIDTLRAEARTPLSPPRWERRYLREKADPYPAQWRFSLEDVALDVSDLQTHSQAAFAPVRDARVRASDQLTIATSGRAAATLDHRLVAWRNDVQAAFTEVTLPNHVVNNPVNSLLFGTQANGQALRLPLAFGTYAVPSLRATYNTEFRPTPGNPRRKVANLQPGLSSTLGGLFEEVRLAGVTAVDLSTTHDYAQHGLTFASRLRRKFKTLTARQDVEFFYFARSSRDTPADLLWQGLFRHRVDVPVWRNLSLSPYLDVFAYRGKLVHASGWSLLTGIGLSYGQLWKR